MAEGKLPVPVAAVAIGRNEGARLEACLDSLSEQGVPVVYVDSGSTDGSVEMARAKGAEVVALDMDRPFTAARARNAGLDHLREGLAPDFVQFVDGDCTVQPDWIATARRFLDAHGDVAVVCGRRRERFPESSVYNAMIDAEWDTPVGEARACGGDALMRWSALEEVGGYNPDVIAGEEPELCVRLRARGWKIWRLDAEMTLHDAAITAFGQWWRRATRAGHAYAEGVALHGGPPERHKVTELRLVMLWGLVVPLVTLAASLITPWGLALLALWPVQMARLAAKGYSRAEAVFLTLVRVPEAQGALTYGWRRLRGGGRAIIEYK